MRNGITLQFYCSDNGSRYIIPQVVDLEEYNFLTDENEKWGVIDIGGNVGSTSLFWAAKKNVEKVIAFEPLKPTYELFVKNLQLNPSISSKIKVFNFGLGDTDCEMIIPYNFMCHERSSIFQKNQEDKTSIEEGERIFIRESARVIGPIVEENIDLGRRTFCKIDCEGAEFLILPNLQKAGILPKINVLLMELHGKTPDDLLSILRESGFFCFYHCRYKRKVGESSLWEAIWFVYAVRIH